MPCATDAKSRPLGQALAVLFPSGYDFKTHPITLSKPEAKPKEPESNGFDANGVEDDDDDDAPLSPVITPNKVDYLLKSFTHLSIEAYSLFIWPLCRPGLLNEVLMILFPSEPLKTNTTVVELFKCFFVNGQP